MPKSWARSKTSSSPTIASALTAGMLSENWSAFRTRSGPRSRPLKSVGM